ncbi:MAG: Rne/Rng family ribonuclease [Lentisphaerae bacterium]|nr:Rne/Rng family ribonuclease [Lentisphaerota bacterium]
MECVANCRNSSLKRKYNKMSKEIILNCEKLERRFALLSNGKLEEYKIERDDDSPKAGDIFLGRIINLDTSLQAAFIDIGAKKNAFLHFKEMLPGNSELVEQYRSDLASKENAISTKRKKQPSTPENSPLNAEVSRRKKKITMEDIPNIFHPGMEILVQVAKAPISTKGARVTTDITIPGRFLVLMPYSEHIGLSSRIEGTSERERLRKILGQLELPEGMGMICRTNGEGRKHTFFKRDLELLLDYWKKIENGVESRIAPQRLFTEPNLIDRTARDFMTDEIDGIVVDDPDAWKHIKDLLKRVGGSKLASKVTRYKGAAPIFDYYRIDEQLTTVFQREVKLPGGGAIVIDETEALIAIDVNTGHGRKLTDQPEFILKTNLEAAEEIARQLRLRNVGGLVVLDFIDMQSAGDRDELYRYMKKLVKEDRAKTQVLPLSKLGLMEMTRQREHESILDQVYDPCPYCRGSGMVKSALTMSAEIQRELSSVMKDKKFRGVALRVFMHPDILARLKDEDAQLLSDLEKKYKNELSFRADPSLHYEEFRLVDAETGNDVR